MRGDPFHGLSRSDLVCPTVPDRYRDARLTSLPDATKSQGDALAGARDLVVAAAAGRPASLVMLGSPGVGKSHLAAAACHTVTALRMAAWRMEANRINAEHALRVTFDFRGIPA